MKMLFTILFYIAFTLASKAQVIPQSQVPSGVITTFKTKFTDVIDVKWELKGDEYKAEFNVGKRGHDVWIDKGGSIKKHKEDFPKSQLPASIKQQLEKDFKDYRLDDVDKIETEEKVFYQVELDGDTEDRKLLFTADGKIHENKVD